MRYPPSMSAPRHRPSAAWLNAFSGSSSQRPWGSVLLGVALVFLVAGLVWGARAFQEASQWVVDTNQVRMDVENILVGINEAESSHRGFLLGSDPVMRRQSIMGQGRTLELSRKLPDLLDENPVQQVRARELHALVQRRFDLIEEVASIYQQGGLAKAQAHWKGLRAGNRLPEQTRDLATLMVAEEHRLLQDRQRRTSSLALWVEVMALAGMTVAIAMVALSGLAYRREGRIRDRATQATQAANDRLAMSLAEVEREHLATQELADFASLLQGCQTIPEIFQVATHSITQILPGTSGSFYLMRTSGDHAEVQADWGDYWKDRPNSIAPSQCWALRQGRAFQSQPDRLVCPHRNSEISVPVDCSTCVPMMVQGSEVGLIFIQHDPKWGSGAMAEAVSEQLALAITNMRLRETLRTQSLRDPLTGLSNRRELDENLPREIARSQSANQPTSLMVLDIDHFKRFNDTFGHDAGDSVLREFAHLLRKSVRIEDIVARLGGEEFIVVLPSMPSAAAAVLAEDIRARVEQMEVVHRGVSLGKITCSIGVAECPRHATEAATLVSTADAALYRAKTRGRNRVAVSDGSLDLPKENRRAPPPCPPAP